MESKEFIQAAFYLKMQKLDGTSQRVGPASLSRYNSLFNGIVEQLDARRRHPSEMPIQRQAFGDAQSSFSSVSLHATPQFHCQADWPS
ncbi:MAG: hypothetical protein HGB15_00935 [Chlorobaculum sp.]|nr:hypothetical protein [Chlorobaculum sp.]